MLRMVGQAGLIAAVLGAASAYLDPEVLQGAKRMISEVSASARNSGVPGSEGTAALVDGAGKALDQGNSKGWFEGGGGNEPVAGRAFFNEIPKDCLGEKVIDLNGRVSCESGRR